MLELNNMKIVFGRRTIISGGKIVLNKGMVAGLVGPSGTGKSSILDILSFYKEPGFCQYLYDGKDINQLTEVEKYSLMKREIAYLRQNNPLLNTLTCLELVLLEASIAGIKRSKEEALAILKDLDLLHVRNKRASMLSGGEKQRLQIALAISKDATIILCDEITSSLDDKHRDQIIEILIKLAHEKQKIVLLTTHDKSLLPKMDVLYEIVEGKIIVNQVVENNIINKKIDHLKLKENVYHKLVYGRLQKHWVILSMMMLLCAVVASIISFTIFYAYDNHKRIQSTIASLTPNELFISNETIDLEYFPGDDMNMPFTKEMLAQVSKIEGVKKIYPVMEARYLDTDQNNINEMIVYNQNNEQVYQGIVTRESVSGEGKWLGSNYNSIVPYKDKKELLSICELKTTNENKNGIFIDQAVRAFLGIEKFSEGLELEMDIYFPTYVVQGKTEVYKDITNKENYEFMGIFDCLEQSYDKVHVRYPIIGILPENYEFLATGNGMCNILIPYEHFMQHQQEAILKHQVLEGEFISETESLYKVIIDPLAERNILKAELQKLDQKIYIGDSLDYYDELVGIIKENQQVLILWVSVIVVMSLLLVFVYGIYHKKDTLLDKYYLNIRGFSKQEKNKVTLYEWGTISIISSIFSIIILSYVYLKGIGIYKLNHLKSYPLALILNIFVVFILVLMMELPTFLTNKKKADK